TLPPDLGAEVNRLLDDWQAGDKTARLWAGDASLWTGHDEADWLGWLSVIERSLDQVDALTAFAAGVRDAGIKHVVLLGMGGSSMAPEVIRETLGEQPGFPELQVLDSTNPGQLLAVEAAIDLAATLFVVSSKSGSSLEPNILMDYFLARVGDITGAADAGKHFIAITDPGTSLEQFAGEHHFRHVFHGEPAIGGRFSALSAFGMVPAALIGVDCRRLLQAAQAMARACAPESPVTENPGVQLGCFLGAGTLTGRDKLTLVPSPALASSGAWLEQLVAESTGKGGKSIIPVDGEALGQPAVYGADRVFVYLRLAAAPDPQQDEAVAALIDAGQPVMQIDIGEVYDLGAAFFCWEIATAVAGAVMGINPFDQPDVEASKIEARRITAACEAGEALPATDALAEDGGLTVYTDPDNATWLRARCGEGASVADVILAHLSRLAAGDYFGLLAFLPRNTSIAERLNGLRNRVLQAQTVATCLGFGPRFLHSTGQAYKGGANNGVFLQLTADPVEDADIPGRTSTFGVVSTAQALGDFEVMAARGRRIIRVHLGADTGGGLARLEEIFSIINQ
ncbi:MAG: bifunctional transaldolase/phosoglucose isomerase, partial [Gammaproteobacteria bacterium]